MAWRQLEMKLGNLDPQAVEDTLLRLGAQSITLTDAGDNPVLEPAPGETPLWNETRISALFDAGTDLDALLRKLASDLGVASLPDHAIQDLEDRAWEREWLKDFVPMKFGRRLWITPAQMTVAQSDAVIVELDPGLAFGTGTHPTTALCLSWLDRAEIAGKTVLDFGCGSGILAIAAAVLGAGRVHAVDIDLQAITATRQNAAQNGVGDLISTSTHLDDTTAFDVVIGNILAGTLVDSAAVLSECLASGGTLVLSGILSAQVDEVAAAYRDSVTFSTPEFLEEWALLAGTRL